MKKIQFSFILFYLLNASLVQAQASTYYFSSSTGSDGYTADQAQNQATPWKSIYKLNNIMTTLQPGDKVLFKRGDTFSGTIRIGVSGAEGYPITFGAYGPGTSKPVLDGCLALTGWTSLGGNIWEAASVLLNGQPTALMVNDVLQPLGRYPNIDAPNRGYRTITSHPAGSKTVFTDNTLSATPDWTGAEVVLRTTHWTLERRTVAIHSGQTITLGSATQFEIPDKYGYFFQNHPAALDKDGEWCYLATGNKIRLYSATDPNAKVIKVANTDKYFDINTSSYLVIDGFTMRGAKKSAVNLTKTTYCTIKNCEFVASGTNALNIGNFGALDNDSITVINNTFNQTQNDCITAIGKRLAFIGNTIKSTAIVPGMVESGQNGYGIKALADGLLIKRNVMDSIGYSGITFLWSGNVEITENVIKHFCSVIDDGAGINTWTGTNPEPVNRKIINNVILNGVGAPEGTNGTFAEAEGIYMDDNTSNVEISGNTVAFVPNSGIYIHNSKKINIKNNTVFACGTAMWMKHDNISYYPVTGLDIQNNLLAGNSTDPAKLLLSYQTRDEATLANLGILDNNIYCQPFLKNNYIKYRYFPSSPEKSLSLNLAEWRAFSGYDGSTTLSPRSFPLETLLSTNGITNSTFDANTNGWGTYNPSGTSSTLSWVTGQLDGGSLSFTVTSGAEKGRLQTALPLITKGKSYLLKLSTKGTVSGSISCFLMQNSPPYPKGSATYSLNTGTTRREQEILITATATLSSIPRLFIFAGPEDGTVYLDNVEFYEVTPSNPNDYIRFEYNTTDATRTITADKNYITPAGVLYASGSTISISAFGSVVLLKNDGEITGIRLDVRTENQVFKLYPNPANDKVYIIGDFGVLPAEATLYDLSGRVIRREMVSTGSPIYIGSLTKGIYAVRISGNKQTQTLKLIKR